MFCQVRVNEEHRDYLRFLFWENGDTSTTPNEYRMRVHLFGATSSPGCANFALTTTAQENRCDSEMAARFLTKNFYVDDGLMSSSTVTEAVSTVKEARKMCAKGGFKLHKFISNSKEVLETIPAEERATGVKDLDLDIDPLPMERVLGVEWCADRDSFKFKISLKNKPVTRRGILSIVSSIYDLLGLAAPLLLRGKRILQHLCEEGIKWDDPVPDELRTRWDLWKKELPLLDEMEVRRCFKPEGFAEVKNAELHHFSDASTEGYGQCSYVRLEDINDKIHCSLVMGKARVAPLKPVTIPRLELTAALVSARASHVIKKELEYSISDEIFWTDSKVVKGYVQNDARRFHSYVANRVQQIRDLTPPAKWLYVDSKNNPADDASRGLDVRELLQQGSRWFHGPEFLWKHCDRWTDQENVNDQSLIPTDDKELKKASSFATVTNKFPSLLERLQYFSDWFRMVRALALCLRYIQILGDKIRFRNSSRTNCNVLQSTLHLTVSVEELKVAERKIIAEVQQDTFSDEIGTLQHLDIKQEIGREQARQRNKEMKKTSQLYCLDPFLDAKGIIRVGGRIKQASISESVKHPAILPRHSHVTQLLIKYFHTKTDHQGRGYTVNEIRSSGFLIMGCSTAVAELIQRCTTCRKLRATVQEQQMADLPADRLEECPPFTYCGVAYFGPWHVKQGRKEFKRYGVLFTCMASRAIHLEVAESLETDSFINAFRRFVCRRGPVRQLRSDQGTNFIGAQRELKEALLEMDKTKVAAEMLKLNCDWVDVKFNVPSASHMGVVWERQIRSVRSVLSSLLENNGTQLNNEALRTFMCKVEAVVNSRPLTTDNLTSIDSVEPLTPNHLLTMKTKVVLPPPGVFQREDMYSRKRWRRVQHLTNEFWCRWRKEFLHSMQERRKWTRPRRNLEVDDLVIIKDDAPRNKWRLARISKVYVDDDGLVSKVKLAVRSTDLSTKGKRMAPLTTLDRPRSAMERPGVPDGEP